MRFVLPILLVVLLCVYSEEVTLTRYSGSNAQDSLVYTLPVEIGKTSFKMKLSFSQDKSWIKAKKCSVCVDLQCKATCSNKVGPAKEGLDCQSPECEDSKDIYNQNNLQGTEAQVDLKIGKEFNKTHEMALVNKVKFSTNNFTSQYDGVLNLLGDSSIFEEFGLIVKDKKLTLVIDQRLQEKYLDIRDTELHEALGQDGSIEVSSIHVGSLEVSTNTKAFLDPNTKSLLLPQDQFKQLAEKIEEIDSGCQLESGKLQCKTIPSLNKMKEQILGFQFGTHKLQMPLLSFVESCKAKVCQLLIKHHQEENIVLGEVLFLSFGVHILPQGKLVTFNRLKNAFSNKYHDIAGESALTSDSGFFGFIGKFILFFVKIGAVVAIFALVVNLYYNKARMVHWIQRHTQKEESHYSPAFTEDIENAGVLQGYDPKNASKEFWQQNTVDGI